MSHDAMQSIIGTAFQAALSPLCCSSRMLAAPIWLTKHQSRKPCCAKRTFSVIAPFASSSSEKAVRDNPPAPQISVQSNLDPAKTFTISLCIGIVGSTVGSLIGAGGGVVVTPLLVLLGLSQHVAHGTSLCVITVTAAMSAFRYAKASKLRLFAAVMLASGAIFTAPFGARSSARVNAKALKRYFGMFLLVVSVLIPTLPFVLASANHVTLPLTLQNVLLGAIGLCTGFLSGLLGIGGGTINVPALVLLAGFSQKVAQGTALLAMLLPTIFASISHAKLNHVRFDLLPGLVLGALIGAALGSELALFLPENTLRVLCAAVFFCIGVRYLMPKKLKKEAQ